MARFPFLKNTLRIITFRSFYFPKGIENKWRKVFSSGVRAQLYLWFYFFTLSHGDILIVTCTPCVYVPTVLKQTAAPLRRDRQVISKEKS